MCIIVDGLYIIANYFPQNDGAPLLGIIQIKSGGLSGIDLPPFIKVFREVTDEANFSAEILCQENYTMNKKDKEGTTHKE